MAGFFVPSGYAMILSLAAPSRRGTTMGAALFVTTFMGTGLIPLITGAISDAIGRQDSIRVAISLTSMLLLIGAACHMRIRSLLTNRRSRKTAAALADLSASNHYQIDALRMRRQHGLEKLRHGPGG